MKKIPKNVIHQTPKDMKDVFISSQKLHNIWNNLTPLARNEWICWVISVKKQETREKHIKRLSEELVKGKKRPCCWAGCLHR